MANATKFNKFFRINCSHCDISLIRFFLTNLWSLWLDTWLSCNHCDYRFHPSCSLPHKYFRPKLVHWNWSVHCTPIERSLKCDSTRSWEAFYDLRFLSYGSFSRINRAAFSSLAAYFKLNMKFEIWKALLISCNFSVKSMWTSNICIPFKLKHRWLK